MKGKKLKRRSVRIVPLSASGHEIISERLGYVSSWRVRYVGRRKGQRYDAAQFDGKSFTRQFVEEWARSQPNLELVSSTNLTIEEK